MKANLKEDCAADLRLLVAAASTKGDVSTEQRQEAVDALDEINNDDGSESCLKASVSQKHFQYVKQSIAACADQREKEMGPQLILPGLLKTLAKAPNAANEQEMATLKQVALADFTRVLDLITGAPPSALSARLLEKFFDQYCIQQQTNFKNTVLVAKALGDLIIQGKQLEQVPEDMERRVNSLQASLTRHGAVMQCWCLHEMVDSSMKEHLCAKEASVMELCGVARGCAGRAEQLGAVGSLFVEVQTRYNQNDVPGLLDKFHQLNVAIDGLHSESAPVSELFEMYRAFIDAFSVADKVGPQLDRADSSLKDLIPQLLKACILQELDDGTKSPLMVTARTLATTVTKFQRSPHGG